VRVLLVHGGLWEDMPAARFWDAPGIVAGLRNRGFEVHAPGRLGRAGSWQAEADHLASMLPAGPITVLAGSNGCSAAVRLALTYPARVNRLLLGWPATAADPILDAHARQHLARLGASAQTIRCLLAGATLRGISDAELASLTMPAALVPALPAGRAHQRPTVDALLRLLPGARELPGCPEPVSPAFAAHKNQFLHNVSAFAAP
jgi:pimeloyl-ACP methyl ester carboxylesterase